MTSLLFDGFALSRPSGQSGIGSYQRNLLQQLAATTIDLDVEVLATDAVVLPTGVARRPIRRVAPGRFAQLEHDVLLAASIRRSGADVFHSPAPYPPRRIPRLPWVQTLYDVIPLSHRDPSLEPSRRRLLAAAPTYQAADAVLAISHHAADEGCRHLGLDPTRVRVVHLAPGPEFHPAIAPPDIDADPFFLLVSAYDARKGFEEAFAVAAAVAEAGLPHRLVVAGALPSWVEPVVKGLLSRAERPDRVELRGFVDDLVGVYQRAAMVIVPSRAEGFGLPAVEAMACGVPVVAFDNTALPEVIGAGGALVPDGDVRAMADDVISVLSDEGLRSERSSRALRRAAAFSWERCAESHVDAYLEVAR